MDAVVFSLDDQVGEDHTHVGGVGGVSDPELHTPFHGGVNDKFPSLLIEDRCCQTSLDIGTMGDLSKSKTSKISHIEAPLYPGTMLGASKAEDGSQVEEEVHREFGGHSSIVDGEMDKPVEGGPVVVGELVVGHWELFVELDEQSVDCFSGLISGAVVGPVLCKVHVLADKVVVDFSTGVHLSQDVLAEDLGVDVGPLSVFL